MNASDALKDKHLMAAIAAKARIDVRTVSRALKGQPGKGLAAEAARNGIKEAGIELPGELPTLSLVPGRMGSNHA